jgi:hypothetical protein
VTSTAVSESDDSESENISNAHSGSRSILYFAILNISHNSKLSSASNVAQSEGMSSIVQGTRGFVGRAASGKQKKNLRRSARLKALVEMRTEEQADQQNEDGEDELPEKGEEGEEEEEEEEEEEKDEQLQMQEVVAITMIREDEEEEGGDKGCI